MNRALTRVSGLRLMSFTHCCPHCSLARAWAGPSASRRPVLHTCDRVSCTARTARLARMSERLRHPAGEAAPLYFTPTRLFQWCNWCPLWSVALSHLSGVLNTPRLKEVNSDSPVSSGAAKAGEKVLFLGGRLHHPLLPHRVSLKLNCAFKSCDRLVAAALRCCPGHGVALLRLGLQQH